MPTLTIQLPGLPPVAHVLREETTTIGRMKGSTIVLDDTSVSLMHAKITRTKEGEYFLKDLNSTNGTLLNGQTVREVKLQDLDQICFADVIAQFHGEEAPRTVQPIVPLMQAPKAASAPVIPSAPATATVLGATPPPPGKSGAESPAKSRRTSSGPAGSGVNRLADRAVPILGGVAVLVVVTLVVWKLVLGGSNNEATANNNSSAPTTASPKSDVAGGEKSPAPKNSPPLPPQPKVVNAGVARLIAALKDTDVEERRRAVRALQSMGSEATEATPALKSALKDSDEEVQMLAAFTLVNNKSYDKPAVPILVRSLKHENSIHRNIACLSLAIFPLDTADKEIVIPALATAAANDDEEDIRQAAYKALTIIAPDIVAKANEK